VDDRLRNVEAADALGISAILYNPAPQEGRGHRYTIVRSLAELGKLLLAPARAGSAPGPLTKTEL
jgi:FMN phosphatase YigB (HAD superfamily)